MKEDFIFHVLNDQYSKLLEFAERCPVDARNKVPDGFNNTIIWHLGHVLVSTELHILYLSGNAQEMTLPAEYMVYFGYGTKPSDWQDEPPQWEVLIDQLIAQPLQLRKWLHEKIEQPVKENFFKAETIGDLVVSTALHASYHVGNVAAMLKALK
ncbi:DinB family protein [Paenibacillus sp. 2TAB23]|uniref:DinB family protein n=1 Tax=Paenibacillus sp. 2TAB23 TaxID=3233004 RepID=UPI003F9835E9